MKRDFTGKENKYRELKIWPGWQIAQYLRKKRDPN